MQFFCRKYNKHEEYSPKNYGGYLPEINGHVCKKYWAEILEIKDKHNKEINDWISKS